MTDEEPVEPRHVLIIDDDDGFVSLARHLLESRGHRVEAFGDGFDALDLLAHERPDVVVVDYVLPRLDGDELCRVIRSMSHLEQIRLVLVSAAAVEADLDLEPGLVDVVLAKDAFPRMAEHLLTAVETLGGAESDAGRTVVGADAIHPRRIARELIDRKRHLERVLDSIDEGILEFERGRAVFANRTACELLGVAREEALNRAAPDLLPGYDGVATAGIADVGGQRVRLELDGRVLEVWEVNGEGEARRIVVISDVTDRQRLAGRLRRAEKLESVGVMASGVAHNFNNLLQGVLGSAAMFELTEDISGSGKELLRNITVCCHRGADLTRRLLEYARRQPERRVPTRPDEVVARAARMVEQGRQDVTITRELAAGLPAIEIDPIQIEEVLVALLMNAAQAMELGGEILLRADLLTVDATSRWAGVLPHGRYVEISVRDHGPGIPPEHRERVFDPFFTTHSDDDRAGLGLASALGVVTGHGGTIDFETRVGGGTTFVVLLPAGPPDDEPSVREGADRTSAGRRVLLVDDDPLILRTCRKMLEHLGFEVVSSDSGARALEVFRSATEPVKLAILDVAMPDMNGWELAEALRERDPSLPVVFTSGYRLEGLPEDRRAGVQHFLAKPFSLGALRDALAEALPGAVPPESGADGGDTG